MHAIRCECGAVRHVPATMAGRRFDCQCGRQVPVPALSKLRARLVEVPPPGTHNTGIGHSSMSAEVRIQQMLATGALPQETDCLICRQPTTAVAYCWCELPDASRENGLSQFFMRMFTFDVIGLFFDFARHNSGRFQDGDRSYRLPLRICGVCAIQLRDPRLMKKTLLDVPVYSKLLAKNPGADVSLDQGLAGIIRRDSA